jgi:hypothetical protein
VATSTDPNCQIQSLSRFYLTKRFEKLDFPGLKIRVSPVYRDLVEALGGTPINTAPGEVFIALERGVVDGYGFTASEIFDLGWEKSPNSVSSRLSTVPKSWFWSIWMLESAQPCATEGFE